MSVYKKQIIMHNLYYTSDSFWMPISMFKQYEYRYDFGIINNNEKR